MINTVKHLIFLMCFVIIGCKYSPEHNRIKRDSRITQSGEELCTSHGGVYYYESTALDTAHVGKHFTVTCFDYTSYDIHTKEKVNE